MDVGFTPPKQSDVVCIATVEPQATYHVPIAVAYRSGLSVRPAGLAYGWSDTEVSWKGEKNQSPACPGADGSTTSLTLHAVALKEQYDNATADWHVPHHHLVLSPLLVLQNLLPYHLEAEVDLGTDEPLVLDLEPAQRIPLYASIGKRVTLRAKCPTWGGADCEWSKKTLIYEHKKKVCGTGGLLSLPERRHRPRWFCRLMITESSR